MDTSRKDDIAETQAVAELVRREYSVSTPVSDHCPYDLVLDDDSELLKVQVKHATFSEGKIECHFKRSNPNARRTNDSYYTSDEIDAYVLYCSENDELYWIDIEDAPKSRIVLRTETEIDHPNTRWAHDYEM
jgi:hypothetical protein